MGGASEPALGITVAGTVETSLSRVNDETSPATTHSASALTASIRPLGGGGVGRGSRGTSAGLAATLSGAGRNANRAFSSSPSTAALGSSGVRNLMVIPTRPYSIDAVRAELTISACPSTITLPSIRVNENRPRRPLGSGSAIGMKITPLRSA
jgi:hypothetical protein